MPVRSRKLSRSSAAPRRRRGDGTDDPAALEPRVLLVSTLTPSVLDGEEEEGDEDDIPPVAFFEFAHEQADGSGHGSSCSCSACTAAAGTNHGHGPAGVDVAAGYYTHADLHVLENIAWSNPDAAFATDAFVPAASSSGPITFVLDFKESGEAITTDVFGNQVDAFDVTSYGFAASDFEAVTQSILAEVREDFTTELVASGVIPTGKELNVEFVIGDYGTPPDGASEYYYIHVGEGVAGPHDSSGILGVAAYRGVRNESGGGPLLFNGSIAGSVFTDSIRGLGGLSPSNALSSGNLEYTTNAIAGTLSHEIAHTLSLSHIDRSGSVQPSSAAPIMGTGAIDLSNQYRITDREFSVSGTDSQNSGASRAHIQQLVDAVGLRDITPPADPPADPPSDPPADPPPAPPSINYALNGSVFEITGTENDDVIRLGFSGNEFTLNGVGTGVDRSSVTRVVVSGLAGDDVIDTFALPAEIAANLFGGEGDDILVGGVGGDLIDGQGGDDEIHGWIGNDSLFGGTGRDVIHGGDGRDFVDGGDDDDTLYGNAGDDILVGGLGGDGIFGFEGNDEIHGWIGNDSLFGGTGRDTIHGGDGRDFVDGGEGEDLIFGNAGNDILVGGLGGDGVFGLEGDDEIHGWLGNDSLFGGSGRDVVHGGDGRDFVDGGNDDDTIYGNSGDDILVGGLGGDRIYGHEGNDEIHGWLGNDTLFGGAGRDVIHGGDGRDFVDGGNDDDTLYGNAGDDTIVSGLGVDFAEGHGGTDTIDGVLGAERLNERVAPDTGLTTLADYIEFA